MAVNGDEVMESLGIKASQRVGAIIDALFEEVLDDPSRNTKEYLVERMKELNELSDATLAQMRKAAQDKYQAVLQEEEEQIKQKYRVS